MEIQTREPKLRQFIAGAGTGAAGSGICALLLGLVLIRSSEYMMDGRDPGSGLFFAIGMASMPFVFAFGFAGFVRWFTEIEFWHCLRASLIALGGYCLVGLAISVVLFGSIDGEYGLVLGYTVAMVASYYGLGAFGILSLLVAMGSAAGFGLSRFGQRHLARRKRLYPSD
jgi:hypothetical protein